MKSKLLAGLMVSALGFMAVIVGDDGSRQWAWQDKVLYRNVADQEPGHIKGENSGGVWHIVRSGPTAEAARPATPTSGAAIGYAYSY